MEARSPIGEVDTRFSGQGARRRVGVAGERLAAAEMYWLTTVRRTGARTSRR